MKILIAIILLALSVYLIIKGDRIDTGHEYYDITPEADDYMYLANEFKGDIRKPCEN